MCGSIIRRFETCFFSGPEKKVAFWKGNWEPLVLGNILKLARCLDCFRLFGTTNSQIRRSLWQSSAKFAARTEVLEHELKRERDEKAELEK